jgi:hypothetical protein
MNRTLTAFLVGEGIVCAALLMLHIVKGLT